MTQEEKAKELVEKFKSLSKKKCDCMEAMCTCFKMYNYKAKQCALMCVDEYLADLIKWNSHRGSVYEYWQEVKHQIEKL